MKIVTPGDLEKARLKRARPIEFVCSICGCQWIADKGEYKDESNQIDGLVYSCNCPTCNEKCWQYR